MKVKQSSSKGVTYAPPSNAKTKGGIWKKGGSEVAADFKCGTCNK